MERNENNTSRNPKKKPLKMKSVKKVDKTNINGPTSKISETKDGTHKSKKKNTKRGWKIFRICLFVFLALFIIGTGIVVGVVTGVIDKTDSVDLDDIQLFKLTSFFYDKDNNEIDSIHGSENRVIVEYKDLPKHVVDAVISIEDERFFDHNGVDVPRTAKAVVTFVLNGGKSSFGGSTITQQLVKNVTDDKESSWTRKIREWYRAISLEKKLKKEEIFESYVNTIYMGDGASGIEVASENYFGKHVKEVNIAEAAVLAAVIQSPEVTNPYKSEEARTKLLNRQKIVLKQMLKLGKITQEEHDTAVKYEIVFKKENLENNTDEVQSYFIDAVVEQVIADLIEEKGWDRNFAEKKIYGDGYKIYTTMDQNVQKAIDEAYNNTKLFYTDRQGDFMQSAMVVMDQSNGSILGLIGGAGKKEGALVKNRATSNLAKNQPGSCMKPFGAYGPAFEQGVLSPGSGLDDSALQGNWSPVNYYKHYKGYVTARDGLAYSMNCPAARANMKVDINYAYNFAKNCGLSVVPNDKNTASLALGGTTEGFTVAEMAGAYATIANGGMYIEPKIYTKVVDRNGKEILTNDATAKRVMKESTAYMLTSCLQSVVQPGGTSYGYIKAGNMPIAGKTGNTDDDFDQWFCGYTPYYTIACWNGYDVVGGKAGSKAINRVYPYTSMRLFNTVINTITKGQQVKQFTRPDTIVDAAVCKVSGLVATDACRTDPRGDQTRTDMFAKGTVPTATCNIHKRVKVCSETGKLVTEFCPTPNERSFISRDYTPKFTTWDWQYMVPTEKCNVHTKAPEKPVEPEDPDDGVDVYKENNR